MFILLKFMILASYLVLMTFKFCVMVILLVNMGMNIGVALGGEAQEWTITSI